MGNLSFTELVVVAVLFLVVAFSVMRFIRSLFNRK